MKFFTLVWASIAPEMEEEGIILTSERTEIKNEESNELQKDQELKRAIVEERNSEMRSISSNGG